jgi:hypothetical protein
MTPIALAAREAVDAALAAGKIPAGRRDHFLRSYLTDPSGTRAILDAMHGIPVELSADTLLTALWPTQATGRAPIDPIYDALYPARS